jgi:hypothetical protein
MSTIIQIKRNSGTTAPSTSDLVIGEMAYAYDASNDGASGKLYIEAVNSSSAADIHLIGGKYYTDLLDHTKGTVTANSAILTDGSSKIDVLNVDNTTINGNDISTTDSNGNLTLTPNGTGMVVINKTDGFKVPVGTTAQRLGSPATGQLRYNSTTSQFEGYAASSWGSLGGVIDVDQDTKITAESAAGQDEDVLTFFTSGTAQVVIADGALKPVTDNDIDLGTSSLEFKDAFFDGTVTSDAFAGPLTGNVAGDLTGTVITAAQGNITSLGTLTSLTVDDVAINGKVVTMTGSSGDTATLTVGTNGTLDITTVDTAAAAANMTLTADGTFEAVGSTITLDSGGAINLEPASGSAILLDGTISVDAGVVTGATSITSTAFVGTLSTAAQGNVTSLGTLSALTVDDVAIDGKVITMTGSTSDTAVMTVGTNGTLSIVTTDDAAAAANIQITADGTVDIDSAGALTLDSGAAINLEPAAGSAILLDGTISVDAGVVTGATSITSTAFVGALTGNVTGNASGTALTVTQAAQSAITSLGTLTILNVDNLRLDANAITSTNSNGDISINPNGTGNVAIGSDTLSVTGADGESASLFLIADNSDDASDDWSVVANTGGTLTIGNDIASAGTQVAHVTITPHATVASSTFALAGALTVAGATTFSGAVDMGSQATTNVNIDSGAIDGVTLGTNSAITNAQIDNININGNTVSSTDSNGNVILAPNGTGNVVANTDTLSISATEGEAASILLQTDEGDDNGDDWTISNSTANVLSFTNDASGSAVSHFQITPNSTVASSTAAFPGHVTVAGNLTITGATTTTSSTNTTIADKLVELGTGSSGSASGDVGHIFERGDDANVFIGWDESADTFIAATGTFTGSTTGNLSLAGYAAAKFGSLTLTTDLAVAEGGTGASSFTDNGIMFGNGASALSVTAAPGSSPETASYQILTANSSGVPKWTTTIDGGTY